MSLLLSKQPLVCCSDFTPFSKTSSVFDPGMASNVQIKRLTQVTGDNEKKNDVIFCGRSVHAESNVVFFGGDIQVSWFWGSNDNFMCLL